MPFPKVARDNLVVALNLANIFTDSTGKYPSLSGQIQALYDLQRYIGWQRHHPYYAAQPGRNSAKIAISGYISLESSVDLFMRYMNIPACAVHANLAYLDENVQKLIYQHFKDKVLRKSLYDPRPPSYKSIKADIKALVKDRVLGYATKPSEQEEADRIFPSDEDWEVFVAEVDVGIEKLSQQYNDIVGQFHRQFAGFRAGQLNFIRNYIDRCLFLAHLESWLKQVPSERGHAAADSARVTAFCQSLNLLVEQNYNEHDLRTYYASLDLLKTKTVSQAQYKDLTQCLVLLKRKYDTYCTGEDKLKADEHLVKFMDAWPRPKLPRLVAPGEDKEADRAWKAMRDQHRAHQESESKDDARKRKLPAGRPASFAHAS